MKILLLDEKQEALGDTQSIPLGLMCLQGYLKQNGYQYTYLRILPILNKKYVSSILEKINPDLIGMSVNSWNRMGVLAVSKIIKKINSKIKIVLGGVHASVMKKQLLSNFNSIDYIIEGEGEVPLKNLADRLSQHLDPQGIAGLSLRLNGTIVSQPAEFIKDLDVLPMPCYDDLSRGQSNQVFRISTSRGCPYKCAYCSVRSFYKNTYRRKSTENTIKELKYLKNRFNARMVIFNDDFLPANNQTKELFKSITKENLNMRFVLSARPDNMDRTTLQLMKDAGVFKIYYGIDSASSGILKAVNRNLDLKKAKDTFIETRNLGIKANLNIILGWPQETFKDIKQAAKLIYEVSPNNIGLYALLLNPGTEIYEQAKSEGIINDKYWMSKRVPPKYYYAKYGLVGELRIYFRYMLIFWEILLYSRSPRKVFDYLKEKSYLTMLVYRWKINFFHIFFKNNIKVK